MPSSVICLATSTASPPARPRPRPKGGAAADAGIGALRLSAGRPPAAARFLPCRRRRPRRPRRPGGGHHPGRRFPEEAAGRRYNAAAVLRDGKCLAVYRKRRLPNYEVFDEKRYFEAGSEACVVTVDGVRCGINICADIWEPGPPSRRGRPGRSSCWCSTPRPATWKTRPARRSHRRARGPPASRPSTPTWWGGMNWCSTAPPSPWTAAGRCACACPNARKPSAWSNSPAAILRPGAGGAVVPGGRGLPRPRPRGARLYRQERFSRRHHRPFRRHRLGPHPVRRRRCPGAEKVRAVMMPSPYTAAMSLDDSGRW